MGAVVLDANLVIAAAEPRDALHVSALATPRSARLVGDDVGAANERDLVGLFGPVRVIDRDVVTATAQLRARHRALRLADAFVIATGLVDRATTLTYDRRLASVHPSVRVLAP